MTEETKPTNEIEEIVTEVTEVSEVAESTEEIVEEIVEESADVEIAEVEAEAEEQVASPEAIVADTDMDDDDEIDDAYDDDDDDYDDDDDEYDDVLTRRVEGPNAYAPREKRGRFQRIGRDIKMEDINYKNVVVLSKFLDPRGRILSRRKTRVSAKIQRAAAREIKRARHLALLPYTADQTRITRKRGR